MTANKGLGPDLNYDDFLAIAAKTTSTKATQKRLATLLADAKYKDDWELAVFPYPSVTKVDVWKIGWKVAFHVYFPIGAAIEVYDSGRRRGTKLPLAQAEKRVANGWWR